MARLPRYMKMENQRIEGNNWVFDLKIAKWGIPFLIVQWLKKNNVVWYKWPVAFVLYYFRKAKAHA